jgi:hypothetical protein
LPIATTYNRPKIKEAVNTVRVVARFYWTFGGAAPVVHHSKIGGQCLRWVDTVEKVSAKEMWNWNLKQKNPGK